MTIAKLDPALLALVGIVVELRNRERLPQLDLAGPVLVMRAMPLRLLRERQPVKAKLPDHRIDHVEDRLGGAEARGNRQVAELARALEVGEEVVPAPQRFRALLEVLPRLVEPLG